MKTKNYVLLFIVLLTFGACKKDPVTKPVKFTSTTYQSLNTYNNTGMPNNLLKDTISASMLEFIDTTLPNGVNLPKRHPELFSSSAIADIAIKQKSTVYITFVTQDGGQKNSIAFYTYPTNQPPTSAKDIQLITYVFPNAGSQTPLQPGDKANLGSFNAGTSIGFVLMQNAWNSSTETLNNDAVHFTSNDALNPEVDPNLKKHAVLINYAPENKIIVGFEDQDRTSDACDNDFNDVTFYTTIVLQ
ncbi:MAG: DUF4114 domain-containing protein [Ginsengibacter sp.]